MLKLFTEKDVKRLVSRLKEEYETVLEKQREAAEEVKEENRTLRARISVLEGERGNVASALVHATREGERIKKSSAQEAENERRELALLAEKCRLLSDSLTRKYPDEDDVRDFSDFIDALRDRLGGKPVKSGFDLEEVTSPKEPLDLEKLCRELGLMEGDV